MRFGTSLRHCADGAFIAAAIRLIPPLHAGGNRRQMVWGTAAKAVGSRRVAFPGTESRQQEAWSIYENCS